jgi:glycosyltransferase involved in cell wall biosynthesis
MNERILGMEKAIRIIHPQIKYLIIHQNRHDIEIPDFLKRNDIEIINSQTLGTSKSRNLGINNCTTEYALLTDDDVDYIDPAIEEVLKIIETEAPDFGIFKVKTPDGEPDFKNYPSEKLVFTSFLLSLGTIEILLNVAKIRKEKIAFDERFGLGSVLRQGDEDIFIEDVIQKGFKGFFYPIFLVRHPYESTGTRPMKEYKKYMLKGAYSQRQGMKYKVPKFDSAIRFLKNNLFFYIGRIYILFTKRTYL